MRKLSPRVPLGLGAAAILVAGGIYLSRSTSESVNQSSRSRPTTEAAESQVRDKPRPIAPTGPLPPLDAPLATVVDDLRRRSAAGEAAAACRLAAEFAGCQMADERDYETEQWLRNREMALKLIDSPASRSLAAKRIAEELDLRKQRDDEFRAHCAGVPIPTDAENAANWRRAALLGNVAAARQYASGNAFRWGQIMDSLDSLKLYKLEAEPLARQAASRGDLEMQLALADAYDPTGPSQRSLLGQVVKRDGAMTLAIYQKVARDLSTQPDPALAELKEKLQTRINQLKDALPGSDIPLGSVANTRDISSWAPTAINGGTAGINPGRVRVMPPKSCEWTD